MKKKFIKNDNTKPNLAILFDCPKALEEVARVMSYGAKKYDRKNWSKCDDKERYESASLRHLSSHHNKELIDSESNQYHLAHSITSMLFLLEMELRK
jgi:hypothetical protein